MEDVLKILCAIFFICFGFFGGGAVIVQSVGMLLDSWDWQERFMSCMGILLGIFAFCFFIVGGIVVWQTPTHQETTTTITIS